MSQEFFRDTLNMLTQLTESPQIGMLEGSQPEWATVTSKGNIKKVSVGVDYSIILHPEHIEAISALSDGGHTVIRDETGTQYGVTVNGDEIHFVNPRAGVNCVVELDDIVDSQLDEISSDTLRSYVDKAGPDMRGLQKKYDKHYDKANKFADSGRNDEYDQEIEQFHKLSDKAINRHRGIRKANNRLDQRGELNEGTWSTPDTPEKQQRLIKILRKPLLADAATHVLYNYIGDDTLFDRIDSAAEFYGREDVPMERQTVNDVVVDWMQKNVDRFPELEPVLDAVGGQLNELSKDTLGKYTKAAKNDLRNAERIYGHERAHEKNPRYQAGWQQGGEAPSEHFRKAADKRSQGIDRAVDRLTRESGDDVMAYSGPSEYETNPYTAREVLQQARGWLEQGEDFDTIREIINAMIDDGAVSPSDAKKVLSKIWNEQLNEVLTPQQQQTMTNAEPGVAGAQTDGNQAATALKQTATAANSAATNANAAADTMAANSQKLDQIQAQQATPKKAAAPMAQNKPTDGQYVIKRGDTLSAIAKANGTTVQDIMKANPQIKDPNRIAAGAGLTLPQKAAPADANVAQVNPTPGNPQVNRPMTQDEFNKLRIAKTAQAQPQQAQAAPQQQGMWAQAKNYFGNKLAANAARQAEFDKQQAAARNGTAPIQAGEAPVVAAESINIGTFVKISTAPNLLSKARVTAINEGQYTVQTRSGTEYTVGYEDLWIKNPILEAKKADKDYDKDGEIESPKAEVMGSRMRAAKKAGKLKESVDLDAWAQEYDDNEENNYHTENVLMVAELVGSDKDVELVKKIMAERDRMGGLNQELYDVVSNVQRRLWPKVKQLFTQQHADKTLHEGEAKKAKKDYDKDGKIESEKDEVMGSRMRAAKKAGKLKEADCTGLGEKARRPKMPSGPVVEGETCCTVKYKMKKSDPKMAVAEYDSREAAEKFLASIKAKGGNGIISDKKKVDESAQNPRFIERSNGMILWELGNYHYAITKGTQPFEMVKKLPDTSFEEAKEILQDMSGGLNELSKDTLKSYATKSLDSLGRHNVAAARRGAVGDVAGSKSHAEKASRRERGLGHASGKLEELSKDTLKSYAQKANLDAMAHSAKSGTAAGQGKWDKDSHDKAFKRARGVEKALDKLEEEVDLSEAPRQSMGGALRNELSKAEPGSKLDKQIKHHNAMVRQFGRGTMDKAPSGYRFDNKGLIRLGVNEKVDLGEKAVSKKQQQFFGMVHAAQSGEKPKSAKIAKAAKSMSKSDVTDFAKTKHKGLPKKVEKTDESTCAGSIAVAEPTEHYGNEAKMSKTNFGKGVYESKNARLEKMINETMSINVSLGTDPSGKPTKSINISATDQDAEELSRILNLAGIDSSAPTIAVPANDAIDIEVVEENMPDWPTNPEVSNDPFQYSGGLNKPKVTGQSTGDPINASPRRGSFNENVELERTLFRLYQNYKGE